MLHVNYRTFIFHNGKGRRFVSKRIEEMGKLHGRWLSVKADREENEPVGFGNFKTSSVIIKTIVN